MKKSELFKSGIKVYYYGGEQIDYRVPKKYNCSNYPTSDKYYDYLDKKRDLVNYIFSNRKIRKHISEFLIKEEMGEK